MIERDENLKRQLEECSSALRSGEARHRNIITRSADGIIIIDGNGTIRFTNPAVEALFGRNAGELVGELFGFPFVVGETTELMVVSRKGRRAIIEMRVVETEWEGEHAVLANLRDITDRKQMEEDLKNSEESLRFASAAADIGMWHWDLEKDELIWSERCKSLFGYPPDYPMTYEAFLRSIHEQDRQGIDEAVHKSVQEKTDYLVEMRVVLSGGQTRWVMSKGRAFYDEQGKPVRMHGIAMDITGRKQMEADIRGLNTELAARAAELKAANQELEAFNYTVAHDLRKPLTVINGYCQVLTDVCGDMLDENCKGYLRETYNGTVRMNRLIEDLLNFSSVGHAEPTRHQVNLTSLGRQVASELKQAEPMRRVTFRIADDISAETDPALLRIILSNLFGNAWKYTGIREEGIIEFDSACKIDGRRTYFVRDNGIGFDSSGAKKLFEPFHRQESAKVAGGLGIGLATVARVIKRLNGEVWAEGEPGKGATFYFTLP